MSMSADDGCGCGTAQGSAWPLERALDAARQMADPVQGTESLSPGSAVGRVLAEAIAAPWPLPRFDHSAMDGYALRRADFAGDGPWQMPIGQRVPAGQPGLTLGKGEVARIFTGAPIPEGADTVIMQEQVSVRDGIVRIDRLPAPGSNIRRCGEEVPEGSELLPAGRRLTARDIAVAACAGLHTLTVRRAVRVALLTTGDELCEPGAIPAPGRIPDVNTPMLMAALARPDVALVRQHQVPDTHAAHVDALAEACRDADLVVTTGGVSVGEEDHVRAAVAALGGRIEVPAVAIKPGKPLTFGRVGQAIWLGLPGNPMSAFVTFMLFGLPLLSGLAGSPMSAPRRQAVAGNSLTRSPGRCELRPACIDGQDDDGRLRLSIGGAIHSGRMTPIARADGCAVIPAHAERIGAGDPVDFIAFPEGL